MENNVYSFWFTYSVSIIIALIGFIVPNLLKENIIFGSRYPNEIINHHDVKELRKNYRHLFITIFLPFIIILGFFNNNSAQNMYFIIGVIVELLLMFFIYISFNRKAKELKKELTAVVDVQLQKKVLTVDTKYNDGKNLIPIWWFVPSFLIIIANIIILYVFYLNIPDQILRHFDLYGSAVQLVEKSYFNILLIPLNSFIIFCIFIGVYFSIKYSKRDVDSNKPMTSILKDKQFRLIWSDYSVIMCTLLITWMFFISMHVNGLLILSGTIFKFLNIAVPLLILSSAVVLAVKTGQSGSKLKININEADAGLNNVDDDSFWKFGMIYFNPQDPSFIVPKRFGVGWTLNFGRPAALAILIILFAFIIIASIFSKNGKLVQ